MLFSQKTRGMSRKSEASATTLTVLLLLAATPLSLAISALDRPVWAQSPSPAFPLPTSVPNGTTVRINGSSSMEQINQALQQRFESQFSGTTIEAASDGSDQALQDVLSGEIDLAAIGRPLTAEEQAQGLVAVPVARNKIAVIVAADNPFDGSLTSSQFAEMFRGQITSWSQVGGTGPLRFIDRPDDSDTRRAFQAYPVFQSAPFQAGPGAVSVAEDSTEAVVAELGTDGVGYAIADQVAGNPDVRAVLMHETPPTDPRYPFSQPLSYVYQGPNPNPAVQAFLGYATAPENQLVVEEARRAGALAAAGSIAQVSPSPAATATATPSVTTSPTASITPAPEPSPTGSPEATATTTPEAAAEPERDRAVVPWWLWLLAIPLLGALLWWLLRDREAAPIAATGAVPPVAAAVPQGRIILTPRTCRDGYAYWEVPEALKSEQRRQQGGRQLKLRLYDVTDIDLDRQPPHSQQQFDCDEQSQDLHLPIPRDNRDYIAELGYLTEDDRWLSLARSAHVRVPPCEPAPNGTRTTDTAAVGLSGTAGIAAAGAATAAGVIGAGTVARSMATGARPAEEQSRVILTPRNAEDAYVYWEIPEHDKTTLRQQGGRDLRLRIYDTTDIDIDQHSPHSVREYNIDAAAQDLHVPLPVAERDRDYVAELGYVTEQGRWLKLARSTPVRVPATSLADRPNLVSRSTEPSIEPPLDVPPPATPLNQVDSTPRRTSTLIDDSPKSGGSVGDVVKTIGAAIAGGAAVAGAGTAHSVRDRGGADTVGDRLGLNHDDVELGDQCRIVLVPRNAQSAYAYWEVSDHYKQDLRQQGGQILMLRIHDATNLDIDYQPAHGTQDYVCDESDRDKHVSIPVSDRDYVAELGYVTEDGRWLRLIRSFHVRILPDQSSG